jgi:hypothetical protein
MLMAAPKIPDRSAEPAVRESLDREKSATAANSSDMEPDDAGEARGDEGNVIGVARKPNDAPTRPRPDSDAGSQ